MPALAPEVRDYPRHHSRSTDPAGRIFSGLGRSLNTAESVRRVGEIILGAADELLGWDAASLDMYSPELDTADSLLTFDFIGGRRTEVSAPPGQPPSPKMRQVICDGAQIILRQGTPQFTRELAPFGDVKRPSASLLFVPVRHQRRVIGVLTIQSYATGAYAKGDLNTLLALADYAAAIALNPAAPETYYNRGVLLQSLGRREKATADFNEGLVLFIHAGAAGPNSIVLDDQRLRQEGPDHLRIDGRDGVPPAGRRVAGLGALPNGPAGGAGHERTRRRGPHPPARLGDRRLRAERRHRLGRHARP